MALQVADRTILSDRCPGRYAAALDFEMVRLDLGRTMERERRPTSSSWTLCPQQSADGNLARALGTRTVAIGHGLAAVESGSGTLISFSTTGQTCLDGTGRNSPFSGSLGGACRLPRMI